MYKIPTLEFKVGTQVYLSRLKEDYIEEISLFQVFALFQRQYIDFKPKSSLYSVKFAIFVRNKYNMLYGEIESYQRCT